MKKSVSGYLCLFGIIALLAGTMISGCRKEDPTPKNTDNVLGNLDGLWVQMVPYGTAVVPHLDIAGNSVILCKSKPEDCDYSDRVSGTLTYDQRHNKGLISFSDGTSLDFICDDFGDFCSTDTIPYYRINTTLDSLQALRISPALQLGSDYVGPNHDLGIDLSGTPLLGSAELGDGAAAGEWYTQLLGFAGKSIASGAISFIGGKAMSAIVSCFYTDPTSQKLESILSQVGEINSKLSELEDLVKMQNYLEYINQRANDYSNPLANYSKRYADAIFETDVNDSLAVAEIVNHWHDDSPTISGKLGGPMDAASNFMDFLMNTRVDQTHMYNIYDIYTFNSVPWENLGYDFRQSLRSCDLSLITSNINMAMLYAKIHNWDKSSYYKNYVPDLNAKFEKFMDFCKSNTVKVDTLNLICQIKDAHFVMDKKMILRNYNLPNGMTWYTVGSQFVHGDNKTSDVIYYGGAGMGVDQFRQKQMTPDEMRAIVKYYGNSKSVKDALTEVGASCPSSAWLLLLQGKTSADSDDLLYVNLSDFGLPGDNALPKYTDWLLAKTHWSITFRYWFDGWNNNAGNSWVNAAATNILYRY